MGMKLLDRSLLEAAYVTYSTIFDLALSNTSAIYPEIATVMTGVGPVTKFAWLGNVPAMEKWIGPRTIHRLRAEKHQLETEWYANGIELDYDDVNEDKLGIVRPRIQQLAAMGPKKIDALVVDMYAHAFDGTLGLAYDGQYLIDTDHTASGSGGTSQSNLVTGALDDAKLNEGIEKMMMLTDANGEPLDLYPDTLLVGPANQLTARELLETETVNGGDTNVNKGVIKRVIVNARLRGAAADYWFLLSTDQGIRPVIVGIEYAPMFAELAGWDQLHMFMHRNMLAGAHMKMGTAYGMWQTIVGSQG